MPSGRVLFETFSWRWCLMTTGVVKTSKASAYFTYLPALLASQSHKEVSKLAVSILSGSALTDTWVKLTRRATTLVDWAWHSAYTVSNPTLSKNHTLDFPARTARYTLSRGPMVRKKKSREQFQANAKRCGLWLHFSLPMFRALLAQPIAWYWTLRDLIFFFHRVGTFSSVDSVALGVNRLSVINAIPAAGFVCVI